jgi:hypothetical protein
MKFDVYGREMPDPTPVEVPLHMQRPLTLAEQVQRLVRQQLSAQAANQGYESFEDADDFDVEGDDNPPESGYEIVDGPPPSTPDPLEKVVEKKSKDSKEKVSDVQSKTEETPSETVENK